MNYIYAMCGKDYEYNAEVGYCKTLCSPYCDGKQHGIRVSQAEIDKLKKNMVWALKMLYDKERGNPVYEEMCNKYIRSK